MSSLPMDARPGVAATDRRVLDRISRARGRRAGFVALLALAVVPLFVAVGLQSHRGWRPVGDDAAIAVLAHDVFSVRTPLVGMPSTIGQDAGATITRNEHAHHPGPMLFWALAGPERLMRSAPIGLLIGTALVNAAALLAVGLVVARLLGLRAAAGALALVAVLLWALGQQWLVDPLNPYIGVLPVLALCTLTWAVIAGRTRALIGVAIAASFVSQAHLIYAPLAAALLSLSAAAAVVTYWGCARRGKPWRREALITSGSTLAALAAAWALPLYDQLAHSPGNFSAVGASFDDRHGPLVGLDWALRLDVQAIGGPPLFARQGARIGAITRSWASLGPLRTLSAIGVVLALVIALAFAIRNRDRIAAGAAATALVTLVTATAAVSHIPVYFDGAPLYRILQMWPVGCFVWIALGVSAGRSLRPHLRRYLGARFDFWRNASFAVAIAVLAIAPTAVAFADSARIDDTRAEDAVGRLAAQLQPRLTRGVPYQVDLRTDHLFIGGAVQAGLFRELERRGFDVRVDPSDEYLGRSHAAPRNVMHLVVHAGRGLEASAVPSPVPLANLVLASAGDIGRMHRLDVALQDFVTNPANLTARGHSVLDAASSDPDAQTLQRLRDPAHDPQRANDGLIAIGRDLIRNHDHVFERLCAADADAHALVDEYVFSVYLVPPSRTEALPPS
jgi:hypothetical protein